MIQLTQSGVRAEEEALQRWRGEFERNHCVYITDFIEPKLLAIIQKRLAHEPFIQKQNIADDGKVFSSELLLDPETKLAQMFWMLLNRSTLFDIIQNLTGCREIGCFRGRVYSLSPQEGHYDSWHNDIDETRMIGVSIELGTQPYQGGAFEIRTCETQEIHARVQDKAPGSVHIFRIDEKLEHRVSPLSGEVSRTALAGWFYRDPNARDSFGNQLSNASRMGTTT